MVHLYTDGKKLLYTSIAFIIVDTIAVVLRLLSKQQTKRRFGEDDGWICAALIIYLAWSGVIIASVVSVGGTYDLEHLGPSQTSALSQLSDILKFLWIGELFLTWGLTLVKISILRLYCSIFATPSFKLAARIVLTLCLLWCFVMTICVIFQCHPIDEAWNPLRTMGNKCTLFGSFLFGYEFTNMLLDVAIICLPITMIRNLHLPARQKWSLSVVFVMGGFVCVTAILRIYYSYKPDEPKQVPSFSLGILWSSIEFGTAIICACLPTYKPLLQASFLPRAVRSWFGTAAHPSRGKTISPAESFGEANSKYSRFDEEQHSDTVRLHNVAIGAPTGKPTESLESRFHMGP